MRGAQHLKILGVASFFVFRLLTERQFRIMYYVSTFKLLYLVYLYNTAQEKVTDEGNSTESDSMYGMG
jgi:hypothetical protein